MVRRIWLGLGTLKIKNIWELRRCERDGDIPVMLIGETYFCWHQRRPGKRRRRRSARGADGK